jgi:sec-independent protein translocase protein TatC
VSPLDHSEHVNPPAPEEPNAFLAMPFLEHLEELRKRILRSLISVIVCSAVALYFSDTIMHWFLAPLNGVKLYVTEVTGSFMAYFKVGLLTGILMSLPIVFWQVWGFVAPGLYIKERRKVVPFVLIATILFLGGASFCYFLVLPFALKFMIGFSGDLLSPIITVSSYISFSGMLLLAFGVCFELPVIAYILGRLGVITSKMLSKGRRIAVVVILLVAGVLTPTPDIFTQLLLAVPLYILYETSIVVVRVTGKRK